MTKSSPTEIRMAMPGDAELIAMNHICSWQAIYKGFLPESILQNLSVSERTRQWRALLQQNVTVLVIEVDKKMIGFASICGFREAKNETEGEISAIYLHPDHWRQGLGTRLCLAALAELSSCGYQSAYLWVLSDNIPARKFYESLGFEASGLTKMDEFYEGSALLEESLYRKALFS